MKSLFFAVLRVSIVILIGMVASAAIALWMFSGKAPTSIKEMRAAAKDLSNFHELKKQMVEKSYRESEKIKDDFDQPAGVTSEQIAAVTEEAEIAAKLAPEIEQAKKDAAREREAQFQQELLVMKNKLANLQAQLDRIENQSRVLTLQIGSLVKDGKVQTR